MVDLSRIIKSIGLEIYLSEDITLGTVELAFRLQAELNKWAESVPEEIRPRADPAELVSLKSARDAQWIKRQRLVLTLREYFESVRASPSLADVEKYGRVPQLKDSHVRLFPPVVFVTPRQQHSTDNEDPRSATRHQDLYRVRAEHDRDHFHDVSALRFLSDMVSYLAESHRDSIASLMSVLAEQHPFLVHS